MRGCCTKPLPRSTGRAVIVSLASVVATASLAFVATPAHAQPGESDSSERLPGDERQAVTSAASADAGAFAPFTMAARSDAQRALVQVGGGYDVAKSGAFFETTVEARIIGPLTFRAGGTYVATDGQLRPAFGAKLDLLRQEHSGIDLAVASAYESYGFNKVAAIATHVAVARAISDLRLLANVGFAAGLEQSERYGDVRAAALYRVARRLRVGLDSRARIDLERDRSEPAGEAEWDVVGGPAATLTLQSFALTGGVGVSALRRRLETDTHVGPVGYLNLGAVF